MVKHEIKNIANRIIPVEEFNPKPGQTVEVELTDRIRYLIKNKFFEDLGETHYTTAPEPPKLKPKLETFIEEDKEEAPKSKENYEIIDNTVGFGKETPTMKSKRGKKNKKSSKKYKGDDE